MSHYWSEWGESGDGVSWLVQWDISSVCCLTLLRAEATLDLPSDRTVGHQRRPPCSGGCSTSWGVLMSCRNGSHTSKVDQVIQVIWGGRGLMGKVWHSGWPQFVCTTYTLQLGPMVPVAV